jgi:hypothetical protein
MKSFGIIAASALFGAIANAAPLNKRDVVWVTEIETDIVTVPVTMTVWANAEETTVSSTTTESRHGHQFFHSKAPKASTTSTLVSIASTTSVPAPVVPTPSSTSIDVAPAPSTTSVYVAPTPSTTSIYVAPTTSTTEAYVAPTTSSTSIYVAPTTSSTSVYVAPTTSTYVAPTIESTSVYVAPTTSTTSSAPAATTSASSGGVSSGLAASGTEYSGDLTWYDVGLGACGVTNVDGDHIVAISHVIFDAYSTGNPNTNPLCGKYVSIQGKDGQTHQAKVVDRCVGCVEGDLDLSHEFFNAVTSNGDGRVSGMSWSWA